MKRRVAPLAVVLLCIAGCGGGDEQAKEPSPTRPTTAPSEAIFHKVANDMRDIAALTAGECANEAAIRRGMDRLEQDAAQLPTDIPQGAEAQQLVDKVLAQARETLRSCP